MSWNWKAVLVLTLLSLALFNISCSGVSREDYQKASSELNTTKDELNITNNKLNSTQAELAATQSWLETAKTEASSYQRQLAALQIKTLETDKIQAQLKEMTAKYEQLQKQYQTGTSGTTALQNELNTLQSQYEEMKKKYDLATQETSQINEKDAEQAIFALVNRERQDQGMPALAWGENLYWWARTNSKAMADTGKIQYSEYPSWQQIFWAAGYNTPDRIAKGALLTWQQDIYNYKLHVLNPGAPFGAVGAYKSGEIIFITYIAHFFK